MPSEENAIKIMQGTLDVIRTLASMGRHHAYDIANRFQRSEVLHHHLGVIEKLAEEQ
jgi:hypothetical protein